MTNALTVSGLTKTYQDFVLDHISFTVPDGSIVGLIGENGSGKSTTLRCILSQDVLDSGTITIYDQNALTDPKIHEKLGVVSDGHCFPDLFSAKTISGIMKEIFPHWEEAYFFDFLNRKILIVNSFFLK